ncbi:hypothetical protein Nepgr_033912 [Nepenthes gracilis]|uniref:Uncharacterized protein n=1 Tax=Nepenthes gracilis TaxID=150966 RepID=A0AAD3Y7A6_NEPGR|nr:hypothetical protein Nepgr_033912 [Nepenthes gracilis]
MEEHESAVEYREIRRPCCQTSVSGHRGAFILFVALVLLPKLHQATDFPYRHYLLLLQMELILFVLVGDHPLQ